MQIYDIDYVLSCSIVKPVAHNMWLSLTLIQQKVFCFVTFDLFLFVTLFQTLAELPSQKNSNALDLIPFKESGLIDVWTSKTRLDRHGLKWQMKEKHLP